MAAWLLGLALAAALGMGGPSASAEVYDDFESATRTATLWSNTLWFGEGGYLVTNGQARVFVTPYQPGGAFSFLLTRRTWTLQEGRTLEFRADLLSSSDDGALALFGFVLGTGGDGYMLGVDEDTIVLWKYADPPTACILLTNGTPVEVSNVKLVLSMTGTNSSVLLKLKMLDNDNAGAVLFEREYLDTAAADPMQRGTDDPPESHLGSSGYFELGVFRDQGHFDPDIPLPPLAQVEVVYDHGLSF